MKQAASPRRTLSRQARRTFRLKNDRSRRLRGGLQSEEKAATAAGRGRRAHLPSCRRSSTPRTVVGAAHLPGDGRGGQGRHDQARHVRHQPAGPGRPGVQAAVERGARSRFPVALRKVSCRERGRIGIFNRSYYEEVLVVRVHPEILAGPAACPQKLDRQGHLEGPLQGHPQLRAVPRRATAPLVLKFFLHVSQGGAEEALPVAPRRAGEELEVLRAPTPRSAGTGRST